MTKQLIWQVVLGALASTFAAGYAAPPAGSAMGGLSKPQYIVQGDMICARSDERIDKAAVDFFRLLREKKDHGFGHDAISPSPEQLEQFGQTDVLPNLQREIDELRALRVPKGDEQTVARIYASAQAGLDRLKKDPSLLKVDSSVDAAFSEADKFAADYGFKKCGGRN
jgi:hypothetical protein